MKVKSVLILSDLHAPFHHKKLLQRALEIAKEIDVIEVHSVGDFGDYYNLSSHAKNLEVNITLKEEIEGIREVINQINKALPHTFKSICLGNHSQSRFKRYMTRNAPELWPFFKFEHLMPYEEMGWHAIDYGPNQMYKIGNTELYSRHEPIASSPKACLNKGLVSQICGHTHKAEYVTRKTFDGKNLTFIGTGCMIDKTHPVFSYTKNFPDWHESFTFIHYDRHGNFWHEFANVVNGKLRFRDKTYNL